MLTILSFLRETPDPQAGQIPDLAQHTAPGWGFSAVGGTMAASAAFFFAWVRLGALAFFAFWGLSRAAFSTCYRSGSLSLGMSTVFMPSR